MKKGIIFLVFLLAFSFFGCDAFVRKFRRSPKKESSLQKEMVLVPEEYSSLFANREEQYRHYFLFWQSWHSEFLNSLTEKASNKKKLLCLSEAIKNLEILKQLLLEEKTTLLERYIKELKDLEDNLSKDTYSFNIYWYYQRAEILRKNILRDYAYPKIKNYLR